MAGSSRVDELVAESSVLIREKVNTICGHWKEMYIVDDKFLKKYLGRIRSHLVDFLDNIEEEMKDKKSRFAAKLEECVEEKAKLEKELGKTVRPPSFPDGACLREMMDVLESQLQDYKRERAERLLVVEKLKEEQRTLCNLLDEPPYRLTAELPSAEVLDELRFRVDELQFLKVQRREELLPIKVRLLEVMAILEQEPSSELEKALIQNDVDSLPITSSRMVEARELLERKELQLTLVQEEMTHLKNELERLWDRIDVPQTYRAQFLELQTGIGGSSKKAILQEKERCEIIKRATIQPIIERLRKNIAELWNLLTLTNEVRSGFRAYHTDTLNEDVLDLHELEFSRLQQLYDENRTLLELAGERQNIMERYDRLEEESRNPDRLKNRGGTLLIEEKERKTLLKNLLKVESKLKAALVSYYEAHDTPFLWWGEDLLSKIIKDEQEHPSRVTPRNNKPVSTVRKDTLVNTRSSSRSSYTTLSSESVASYSQFQEQIELGATICRPTRNTPIKCTPLSTAPKRCTPHSTASKRCTPHSTATKRCTPHSATSKRFCTPATRSATSRLPLRQIQPSPYYTRAHSSPTTPKRLCLSKPSPRRVTPRRFGLTAAKSSLHF